MAMYDIGFTITESHMKRTDREPTVFFFIFYLSGDEKKIKAYIAILFIEKWLQC